MGPVDVADGVIGDGNVDVEEHHGHVLGDDEIGRGCERGRCEVGEARRGRGEALRWCGGLFWGRGEREG